MHRPLDERTQRRWRRLDVCTRQLLAGGQVKEQQGQKNDVAVNLCPQGLRFVGLQAGTGAQVSQFEVSFTDDDDDVLNARAADLGMGETMIVQVAQGPADLDSTGKCFVG